MSTPFGPQSTVIVPVNGHRHDHPVALEPGFDVAVVRQIRREVAERLTRANRAQEAATSTPIPAKEREALTRRLINEALDAYATAEMQAGRPPLHPQVESRVARTVADALLGAGGLEPWLNNPQVEDIVANGCDRVFIRFDDGRIEQVDPIADSDAEMVDLIRMLAARTGNDERRWDRAAPLLNLQLEDGSRLNAVLDVVRRPSLSIRRHRYMTMTLPELVELGAIDTALAELFGAAVRARLNTVVGGPTGAGKTTFLRGLASAIPAWERLVTIEDTYELGFDKDPAHPNVAAMQTRDANVEGEGAIDMATLFGNALRMVPSRVFVGEVRGREVVPLLNAMSQGNDGSMSTIHASSSAGVFRKLALYAAAAPERLDPAVTNMHIAEGLHLVVQLRLTETGRRFVTSVREVVESDGLQVASNEIFRPGPDERAVPGASVSTALLERLVFHGFDPALLQRRHGWWDTTATGTDGTGTRPGRGRTA
ncbi:CpaF family protein [Asanoa siamensis]|uniref:Protein kinase n=1 Tax=Asanoa siamensis TaxID=926357 RepID=A0ABQ4CS72_9ACTN|nr:ATPase, T2SS/T4P/T4SS family [Asanoa siamensis]GIF74135.1 protein kinase [Asanoa siamensis]